MAINGADNAALLAVQILAAADENLADKLGRMKEDMQQGVIEKDRALQEKITAL